MLPFCSCQTMDISPTLKFTWDANEIVRSLAVTAPTWVTCLIKWAQDTMEDFDRLFTPSLNSGKLLLPHFTVHIRG
jgi:hypothetical protein